VSYVISRGFSGPRSIPSTTLARCPRPWQQTQALSPEHIRRIRYCIAEYILFFVPSNSSRSVGRARENLVTPRCVGGVEGDDGCVPDPEARARIVQFNLSLRDRALRPK
jgi:hypothetical protein